MRDAMKRTLANEAAEAEEVAEAEDRGEREPAPGQRPPPSAEASQVYSLRLPASAIAQLRAMAERMDEPPTVLLRRLVLDRLAEEARGTEPVDVVAAAVDDLLPLLRQRLLEAARAAQISTETPAAPAGPPRTGVNLGPSRRRSHPAPAGRLEKPA